MQAPPHIGHIRSGVDFDILVRWLRARVLREEKICADDLDLLVITDDPAQAARFVTRAYELQTKTASRRAEAGS